MLFTTADGAELFYEVLGPQASGLGPTTPGALTEARGPRPEAPVVFLNGIMMTTRSWTPMLAAFTDRFRCILHDFRGQLRSPYRGPFNIEQHADDLAELLGHLGDDRAHIVGTSYGGEVGMIFAYTYPELVQSLTVIASTSVADERMREGVFTAMNVAVSERDRLFDVSARAFFSPGFLRAHPEVLQEGRARLATYGDDFFTGYVSLLDAFSALDITGNLRGIRCPTLVIAAERDTLKPVACSETIVNEIENSKLVVIPGVGHAVFIESPDAVAGAVSEFLG